LILILFSDIFISVKTYKIKKLTYDKKYNTIGKNVINKGECLMNEYQIQQERSKRLKQVIYRKFAKKYGQIQKTDLLDHEKDTAIKDILYTSINAEKVIDWDTEDGLKISDEDRSTFGIEEHEPEVDPKVVDTLVWIFATKAKMPNNMGTGLLEKITLRDGQKLENIDFRMSSEVISPVIVPRWCMTWRMSSLKRSVGNWASIAARAESNASRAWHKAS